jgi:2-dehydro-3-deoxyphosphogluconate aldolase/(4S)-4-hydroxy-2-oxoglutarate aldolase
MTADPRQAAIDAIARHRVIGVIRAKDAPEAVWAAETTVEGGLPLVEITLTTPGAYEAIARLRENPNVTIGAGTVLDEAMARQAIKAGAQFLVSPHTDPAIIQLCRDWGVLVAAGAATPTEALHASRLGADLVKIFPAETLGGPRFLKLLLDPLPWLKLMPTGGVTIETLGAYFDAGAHAAGVASVLYDKELMRRRDEDALFERVHRLLAQIPAPDGLPS